MKHDYSETEKRESEGSWKEKGASEEQREGFGESEAWDGDKG